MTNYFEKLPEKETRVKLDEIAGILKKGKHLTDKEINDIKWEHLKKKHGL